MARAWVSSPAYEVAIGLLIAKRHAAGLTQRDLAAKLEKPPSFVGKLESRERRLDLIEFIAIARALGLSAPALMQELDDKLLNVGKI
ncbi:helix-turn-helix transcriptional regulator [Caulobacter sp. 602-2]|uniref:Helix-turn-helix transcriptional regulator n=1 Tax=Caulobacter sp. 602-2 TaxID=2710887 RepID=A0A6G4R2H5_9CAUL|nr:helix-turn-helix transcriptional regulator [Caulobacter sp. 602-2]NGM51927.1 helix-turn-helix transcriptional regulator [Caulobacter sp. 602-2]